MRHRRILAVGALALAVGSIPQIGSAKTGPTTFVFNGEGNRLNAYDTATGAKQTVTWSASDPDVDDGREHKDINAQICFQTLNNKTYFIAGEDTGQGGQGDPGWGWFELVNTGDRNVSKLRTHQRGKLVPTYWRNDQAPGAAVPIPRQDLDGDGRNDVPNPTTYSNPENYGCGFLDNGALVLSDVGDQLPHQPATGQLHVWFPDHTGGFGEGFGYSPGPITDASNARYCMIDIHVPTAGGIAVDHGSSAGAEDDVVYLASNRFDPNDPAKRWGIMQYTGIGALSADDCDDSANAGLTSEDVEDEMERDRSPVRRSVFIQGGAPQLTPSAIVASGKSPTTWYVSSVYDGNVAEYDVDGTFLRYVVGGTPTGQVNWQLPSPLDVGTPYGLGVANGQIWYADIGVVGDGPNREGRVMKISADGTLSKVDGPLAFPDGIGVLTY